VGGFVKELLDQILKILQERIGWRPTLEILSVLLGASVTTFLISRTTSYPEILAVGIWICAASWYFWLVYRTRLVRPIVIVLPVFAFAGSAAWTVGLVRYLGAPQREVSRLAALAGQYVQRGLYAEAVQKQAEAVSVAQRAGDRNAELEPLCRLAHYESLASQRGAADVSWHSCLSLTVELRDRRMEGFARDGLAQSASFRGQIDLARKYYADAISIFEEQHDFTGEAEAQLGLGILENRQGNTAIARQYYSAARDFFRQHGNLEGEASVLVFLSESERLANETDDARKDIVHASELYRNVGNLVGQAHALYELAELESRVGHATPALEAYGEARGLYQQVPNRVGEANVLRGMGDLELARNNIDLARGHYLEAQQLFEHENDPLGKGATNLGLGRIEIDQMHFDAAHDYLSKARFLFEQVNDLPGKAQTDYFDGYTLAVLGQRDAAVAMLGRAASEYTAARMNREAESATQWQDKVSRGEIQTQQ
jgi:tetratricopeptide (TPR) repeat protein